jgi:hypothetical protein
MYLQTCASGRDVGTCPGTLMSLEAKPSVQAAEKETAGMRQESSSELQFARLIAA